jgi:hypothetical protein
LWIYLVGAEWPSASETVGGLMLIDESNTIRAGFRFDLSAEEVIKYCAK